MESKAVRSISLSGLTIYDSLETRPELYLDIRTLEKILNQALVGLADFFTFFRRFEGNVQNAKLQIPLPAAFFD
jgi:hypothetical protein